MQPDTHPKPEHASDSPHQPTHGGGVNVGQQAAPAPPPPPPPALNTRPTVAPNEPTNPAPQFPPPKTDKPRPHVCNTCGRSFARLEHLKRHERSHTKEKPFECPECTRCFARRDLLLRHQQKLHMTNTTSSRPRNARRESVSGASVTAGGNRVRKNSMANGNMGMSAGHTITGGGIRPRANTISHVDLASLGLTHAVNGGAFSKMNPMGLGIGLDNGMGNGALPPAVTTSMNMDYSAFSPTVNTHAGIGALPKLNTSLLNNLHPTDTLHTAPPLADFGGFDLDQIFSPGTTINPSQLHLGDSTPSSAMMPMHRLSPFTNPSLMLDDDAADLTWMRNWGIHHGMPGLDNENAIEESSPSRISSGDSPGDHSDSMINSTPAMPMSNGMSWSQPEMHHQQIPTTPFHMESLGSGLPTLDSFGTMSPNALHEPTPTAENYFHKGMAHQLNLQQQQRQQQQQQQHLMQQQQYQHQHQSQPQNQHHQQPQHQQQHQQQQQQQHQQYLHHQHQLLQLQQRQLHMQQEALQGIQTNLYPSTISNLSSDSPSMSSSSMTGSGRQSSVTSISTDSITDATRQALLSSLAQPSVFGHTQRKYSQPSVSSPLSPGAARLGNQGPSLPSTADLRRYVEACIQYAYPHMPLIHIPTLSFDSIEYSSSSATTRNGAGQPIYGQNNIVGGGAGCLILAMAAMGALYEYDHPASKELFEAAKKMIGLYLEERRKADMSAAMNGGMPSAGASHHTPLWLVQAMLLNVIYGHQCGDKMAADIASNHCAALVSLARAADLAQPASANFAADISHSSDDQGDLQAQWLAWKLVEERKRTFFAIFILSSLLTSGYNQTPTIMNSEIMLDLPCDEELWSAESAQEWHNRGGLVAAEQNAVSFAGALSTLLTANQRQQSHFVPSPYNGNMSFGGFQNGNGVGESDLRLSTFGCLVLINALHNYIWETRSRHNGRQWTVQESESMFSHIEPALNAWQAAWKANAHHKLERPNPFGLGPLSADSIPLLDLAFVHLFVNLGRAKEAFWRRDFDGMAEELAKGSEIVQHADTSPDRTGGDWHLSPSQRNQSPMSPPSERTASRRERHLRKAAFYAADSLIIACNFNLTYADATAHELPIQSAICFFDCGQVLAEWAVTVQERVGRYMGVLGRDPVDFSLAPAKVFLEDEDVDLMQKIASVCESVEAKRLQQENILAMDLHQLNPSAAVNSMHSNVNLSACGYGGKLLRALSMMLEKAVVWPVTHVMAKALETQAGHMDRRAEVSVAH